MNTVPGVIPCAVHQDHPDRGPTEAELSRAYDEALRQGWNPRFLLLTNPNNPLGCIYSAKVLESAVQWARQRGLHTVVDEIYAMSSRVRFSLLLCSPCVITTR
jgi:aspartate/methionine/tyrosine aminotransferase